MSTKNHDDQMSLSAASIPSKNGALKTEGIESHSLGDERPSSQTVGAENRSVEQWSRTHSIETTASASAIWRLFADVQGWVHWNPGIESIEIHGPFAAGTVFHMTPPGQERLTSRLSEVRVNRGFVDETAVGDLLVRVAHRIEELPENRRRVAYAVEATGPGASEIGPAVSADFPQVLASLRSLAESTS